MLVDSTLWRFWARLPDDLQYEHIWNKLALNGTLATLWWSEGCHSSRASPVHIYTKYEFNVTLATLWRKRSRHAFGA
jgi:hypothetical protein